MVDKSVNLKFGTSSSTGPEGRAQEVNAMDTASELQNESEIGLRMEESGYDVSGVYYRIQLAYIDISSLGVPRTFQSYSRAS